MPKTLIVALAFASLPVLAQNPAPQLSCKDDRSHNDRLIGHCEMKELTLGAPRGAIQIDPGINGGVTVKGWSRNEVLVRAQIQTAAETESEARAMAPQIRVESGAGQIRAEGPHMDRRHNWAVSYEIFLPRQSDVRAKAHNGGIHIADVRGNIEFEALNGGVTLQRLAGEVHGHTTNGGLTIELAGERWDGHGMDVATTNGGVKLDVPSNYSGHFESSTVNGNLNVDFPVTVHGRIDKDLSFDVGQGGATIRAVTTNGGVKIRRS
jgi:DUF4097 and DUF4098 domain-containing protein YvlB